LPIPQAWLCKEQNLSVIIPQGVGKSYAEWEAERQGTSWKAKLKTAIDTTILTVTDFENFIKRMEEQSYTIKRGKHISFKAPGQERFTRAKRLGAEYTEEEIKSRIAKSKPPIQAQTQKTEIQTPTQTLPPQQKPQPQKPTPPPKQAPKSPPPLEGIALWESIIRRPNTAEIYNLMQQHGGYQYFIDLMTESRIAHETIDNGIKANEQRISGWGYVRKDISDLNRTRKIYDEYKVLQKSTKLFAKRTAEKFYNKHEDTILTHEKALRDLKDYKRSLPTLKDIDGYIDNLKNLNVKNAKAYRAAKAEHTRFTTVHKKLYAVNHEHKPKAPQRQKQRSQDWEL